MASKLGDREMKVKRWLNGGSIVENNDNDNVKIMVM